ncbi:hypothetical protein CYMTET_15370 [Cymbomonas tetramitiformis]|nr:hypothetical protein CYMTET_15370 [Cymbomonas tetramitiformis]
MDPELATRLLRGMDPAAVGPILAQMDPEKAMQILEGMPDAYVGEVLASMPPEEAAILLNLMKARRAASVMDETVKVGLESASNIMHESLDRNEPFGCMVIADMDNAVLLLASMPQEDVLKYLKSLSLDQQAALLNSMEVKPAAFIVTAMDNEWQEEIIPLLSHDLQVQVRASKLLNVCKDMSNNALFKKWRVAANRYIRVEALKKKLAVLMKEMETALAETKNFNTPSKTLVLLLHALLALVSPQQMNDAGIPEDMVVPTNPQSLKTLWRALTKLIVVKKKRASVAKNANEIIATTVLMLERQVKLEMNKGRLPPFEAGYWAGGMESFSQIDSALVKRAFVPAKVLYMYMRSLTDLVQELHDCAT